MTDHETRRNPEMEKYIEIQPVVMEGFPDAHNVFLKVANQSFQINDGCDTREEAEWLRDMLCVALAKIVSDAQSPKAQEGGSSPVQGAQYVHIDNIVCHLDDIEVDANGQCSWTDVANALTHIKLCIESYPVPTYGAARRRASPERRMVVGRVTGKLYDGDQVSGMPGAICHACGLQDYPCVNPDCPNKAVSHDPA